MIELIEKLRESHLGFDECGVDPVARVKIMKAKGASANDSAADEDASATGAAVGKPETVNGAGENSNNGLAGSVPAAQDNDVGDTVDNGARSATAAAAAASQGEEEHGDGDDEAGRCEGGGARGAVQNGTVSACDGVEACSTGVNGDSGGDGAECMKQDGPKEGNGEGKKRKNGKMRGERGKNRYHASPCKAPPRRR